MLKHFILTTIQFLALNQLWDDTPTIPPEEQFTGPNLVLYVFAWIFLSLGIVALAVLILHSKYGREISVKLSVITITLASIFLGFAFHFFLLHFGY